MSTLSNKICRLCGLEKPLGDFHFRKDRNTYRSECRRCRNNKSINYHSEHREYRIKQMKNYNLLNKKEHLEKSRKYYKQNKDQVLERNKKWRDEFRIASGTSYNNYKYHNDLNHKLKCIIRNRLADALKSDNQSLSHIDIGCSIEELKWYLESKFQPGMTWDNHSLTGWHIDHIIPLRDFDLSDIEQLKKASHYTNLQPLWCKDNWYKNRVNN